MDLSTRSEIGLVIGVGPDRKHGYTSPGELQQGVVVGPIARLRSLVHEEGHGVRTSLGSDRVGAAGARIELFLDQAGTESEPATSCPTRRWSL